MKDTLRSKNPKQPIKGFDWDWDKASERLVLEIHDTDGMFPFLIKINKPTTRVYEIVQTRSGKLSMR
jgi:hypothetical protein